MELLYTLLNLTSLAILNERIPELTGQQQCQA